MCDNVLKTKLMFEAFKIHLKRENLFYERFQKFPSFLVTKPTCYSVTLQYVSIRYYWLIFVHD